MLVLLAVKDFFFSAHEPRYGLKVKPSVVETTKHTRVEQVTANGTAADAGTSVEDVLHRDRDFG